MNEKKQIPKTVVTEPVSMEMSRTEEGPPDENDVRKLSLSQKLKDHYNKLDKNKKKKTLENVLTPAILNKGGVIIFLFTFVATMKIGVLDVMPLIYEGEDWVVICHQLIVLFIGSQMFMNWLGIRYMISTYPVYKRRFDKEETTNKDPYAFKRQENRDMHSSTSVPFMPLITESNEKNILLQAAEKYKYHEKDQEPKIERGPEKDLTEEVKKANQDMQRRLDEEENGIKDLIKVSNDTESLQFEAKTSEPGQSTKNEEDNVKFPKPVVTSTTKTLTYPYWSWTPCFQCNSTRPPRCHHCPLCNACILKRDHHCYFAGSCVGYRNLRFFYIFLIWSWIGSMWATLHGFPYIYYFLWNDMSYFDVLFFIAIIRWIFGYVSFQAALSVTTLSLLIYFDLITSTFIYAHTQLINWGITSFEKVFLKKSLVIKDTRSRSKKLQAVFGKNWFLMFFIPIHFVVEPIEDPVNWPHIKVFKD